MGLIISPNIKVDNIEINKDDNDQYGTERILGEWGKNIPIIKIGEYVLAIGDLEAFSLKVALNCLPTFSMTVNDDQYFIREALKNDIDKCVIFIGYAEWYIKFNGIINKTYSDAGDSSIELTGTISNDKLYNNEQFVYRDTPIVDILTDVATKTSMGLFTIDNKELNHSITHSINNEKRLFDFFVDTIKRYTSNVYSVDCFYFMHVCNLANVRNQPIDKYSLDWKTGKQIEESPIIFKSYNKESVSGNGDNQEDDKTILIDYYTTDTNFTGIHYETSNTYSVKSGGTGNSRSIDSIDSIGISESSFNTFAGFEKDKFPFYNERVNKMLGGNLIKIKIPTVIFELSPFSVVGLELYLPFAPGRDIKLDEVHSGKKVVIGYTIDYEKNLDGEPNYMTQSIELI